MGVTLPVGDPGAPRVDWQTPIAADLREVERILAKTVHSGRAQVGPLVARLDHYRGKRLRPALLLLVGRACGRTTNAHRVLAAVVELIHTATLVHDDVLDAATVRRRHPTINADCGNRVSILLGDYLFTHAFHLASSVDAQACRIIGEATNRVCEGELHQGLEQGNLGLDEPTYLDIVDAKTAELTACCCRLGSLYSGATEERVRRLTDFGRWLGMAFQLADDILDLVGEEQAAGKSLGTDVQQQKLTLPLIRLLDAAPSETAERVRAILNSPGNHKREALTPFLVRHDALRYASQRAEEFAARARGELQCLPASDCRSILELLTEKVVHRSC